MKKFSSMFFAALLVPFICTSQVSYSPVEQVVPGPGLPPEVKCMKSNNNLDIIRFDGRLFMGFRTAPNHFAGKKVRHYIVSSTDEGRTWEYEAEVFMGSDMREPRFLELNGKLLYYFFQAGKNPFSFTPQQTFVMERKGLSSWTGPEPVGHFGHGYILWRAKVRNGTAYVTGYHGGESMYKLGNIAPSVHFMTTADGRHFEPVSDSGPVVVVGGNETAFEFDSKGDLYAAVRNEGGDGKTWGGKVCKAEASDLGKWECKVTPYKYDSPLMFRHNDDLYLIARRNIDGYYDKNWRGFPGELETGAYLLRYWFTKKRTALYKLDKDNLALDPVLDFPTRGDTAFPGLAPVGENSYLMYNYSSDPEGPDRYWLSGQLHPTQIYSTVITFEK